MDEHFHLEPDSTRFARPLAERATIILFLGASIGIALGLVGLGIWAIKAAL